MRSRAAALTLSVLFKATFFACILSSTYSSADVTGSFAFAFAFFSFVFILSFSGITVVLAMGSKPGINTHLVPSELKLDRGGEGESIPVVYVHEEVNAHFGRRPTLSQQPSAWEVELGDERPSLRPRELRVSSVYLLMLRRDRSRTRRE